ncbi:SCP2 sterol-binding domain-containing protein [Brassicibacter mesophilus]|uniref:SCP2 sterol-binding domain-containing protein n=1 Tax=Brassicibacter mesophilus TaxID=745119 RepID=UPI003D1C6591
MEQGTYKIAKVHNKRLKKCIINVILWFLGRGIQSSTRFDENVKKEIEIYHEGFRIMFKVWNSEQAMIVEKRQGRFYLLKNMKQEEADIIIYFKSMEAALMLLTGKIGIAQGYAQHRILLKGDIMLAMPFIRMVNIVEAYLFPRFWVKRILKSFPDRSSNSLTIYLGLILGI